MYKIKRGFTLVELIITMSLIAILSSFGMNSYLNSQKRARDAERQSDLYQYRVALENYASVNGSVYPFNGVVDKASTGVGIFNITTGQLASYLTGSPKDPNGTGDYYYTEDATGSNWVLQACMEAGTVQAYKVCSNGLSGIKAGSTCAAPSSTCDLP